MTYASTTAVSNKSLRQADFAHFKAMCRGSELLRDQIRIARGEILAPVRIAERPIPAPPVKIVLASIDLPVVRTAENANTWREVMEYVAVWCGVEPSNLIGPSRLKIYTHPRGLAMLALHRRGTSYSLIGRWFRRKDHSTVINSIQRALQRATPDELAMVESLARTAEADNAEA